MDVVKPTTNEGKPPKAGVPEHFLAATDNVLFVAKVVEQEVLPEHFEIVFQAIMERLNR